MDESMLIEVALRDLRNIKVIMALDRLVILPTTREALQLTMSDLSRVKSFIAEHLPEQIQPTAQAMFIEHAQAIKTTFSAPKGK